MPSNKPPKKIIKKDPVKKPQKPQPPPKENLNQDRGIHGNNDPYSLNEGDDDLKPYLDPLLKKAGGQPIQLEQEVLRRATSDTTLRVVGIMLWTALHSESWRHREAAAEAFFKFISDPKGLPKKYKDDTLDLFKATAEIAEICINDKLI